MRPLAESEGFLFDASFKEAATEARLVDGRCYVAGCRDCVDQRAR
jgi:hypothetical protein